MNTSNPPSRFSRQQGVALVIVLSIIVLITALVVGFLSRAGADRNSTSSYSAKVAARQLADMTVNLVQAQINDATSQGTNKAWASQPGAVRVYDNSGALLNIYRLYSSGTMTTSQAADLANDVPPATWANSPAMWVDLNAPVSVPGVMDITGTNAMLTYPIIDPRDPANPGTSASPTVLSGTKLPGFFLGTGTNASPIPGTTAVPGATTTQPVPMPVRWMYVLKDGAIVSGSAGGNGKSVTVASATKSNPVVGRVAFWTDDETCKVNINTAAGNVLPGGTCAPAYVPRFKMQSEFALFSTNQPVNHEYQRYPGHPATTDLSVIFNALGMNLTPYPVSTVGTTSPYFSLLPRYNDDNGSKMGTRNTTFMATGSLPALPTLRADRLYASVGELLYSGTVAGSGTTSRTQNVGDSSATPGVPVSRQQVETGKFFLTARSRAPELTLFGTPRVSMWPVYKGLAAGYVTAYDQLAAFCSTINSQPYYFQRQKENDSVNDFSAITQNQNLYKYLQYLTAGTIPGFGGSFANKYSFQKNLNGTNAKEIDQILTEVFDYIRCTNLNDCNIATSTKRFGADGTVFPITPTFAGVSNGTRGIGRIYTISEIGLHIICTAEGSAAKHDAMNLAGSTTATNVSGYQTPLSDGGGNNISPAKGSANDPQYVSNLPVAQYLRDTTGAIVGWDSTNNVYTIGTATAIPGAGGPFPSNKTLAGSYSAGDPGPGTQLAPGDKRLQAAILLELTSPMQGYSGINQFQIQPRVSINGLDTVAINSTGAGFPSSGVVPMSSRTNLNMPYAGNNGFRLTMTVGGAPRINRWSNASGNIYPFISNPLTVSGTSNLSFNSGSITIDILPETGNAQTTPIQTFNVQLPAPSAAVPLPDLIQDAMNYATSGTTISPAIEWWGFDRRMAFVATTTSNDTGSAGSTRANENRGIFIRADSGSTQPVWRMDKDVKIGTPYYNDPVTAPRSDVVRSFVAREGDIRLVAARSTVTATGAAADDMVKHTNYDSTTKLVHSFMDCQSSDAIPGCDLTGKLVPGATYGKRITPKVPSDLSTAKQQTWDWDNGLPFAPDGAYVNKPDEGNVTTNVVRPYYDSSQTDSLLPSFYTPNRIVSSPVMFGSLPTGAVEGVSWRTLLFRPQASRPFDPAGPKDHLFLDLFNVPIVEPYGISEPFSTAGKVNMNYQIVPFTYITRDTAVRAVLGSELIAKLPKASAANAPGETHQYPKYKGGSHFEPYQPPAVPAASDPQRLPLNLSEVDGTLRQFVAKFANGEIFKSASEICDIYLVPQGYSWPDDATADAAWYGTDFSLVGDNTREQPYGQIYPRLTTKSNTFTVHFKVQSLKNNASDPTQWNENSGAVLGEYRGSTTLERYLDPNDSNIPNYGDGTDPMAKTSIDKFYKWRIISNNTFAP